MVEYRSRIGKHFYGIQDEIWAGFGPVGNTDKKVLDFEQKTNVRFLLLSLLLQD